MKIDVDKITKKSYCERIFKHHIKKQVLRKTNPELYKKHLIKSITNLEFGNYILEEHNHSIKQKLTTTYYDWCITVYYYAIYRTALALLTKLGYSSKSHLATVTAITLFYYHKNNILKKEDIDFLIQRINLNKEDIDLVLDTKGLRERACYGTNTSFESSMAKQLQIQTAEFVNKIRALLE